ncbi:MAG: ATP-grasp domain-containing protein [Thermodesulfobacteriota bacterium]
MSERPIHLLITAVGSELALSVIKAARLVRFPLTLFGCDIHAQVVGRYWCNGFRTVPPAREEDRYIAAVRNLVREFHIDALVPTADAEFEILARHRDGFRSDPGCRILVNPLDEIRRFTDKWATHQWFQKKNIPSPATHPAETEADIQEAVSALGFPMMLKPRTGGGSRHIWKLRSMDDLRKYLPSVPRPVLQEYVFPDDEEYTAGTYRSRSGEIYAIVLKRALKFGMTNSARSLAHRPELEAFCAETIRKTNLEGSNNIQFRIDSKGPRVMEINPRFSGTTGIRANCGFNDLEMWLTEALDLGTIRPPTIRERLVMRYMEELYVDI